MTTDELSKLSAEEKRIRIAEILGWTAIDNPVLSRPGGTRPGGKMSEMDDYKPLPDYLNDLNAMHEAEKSIPPELRYRYVTKLMVVIGNELLGDYNRNWHPHHATAAQRADAFLLTVEQRDEDRVSTTMPTNTRLTDGPPTVTYIGQAKNAKDKWIDKREFETSEQAYHWLCANTQHGKTRILVKTVSVVHWKLSKHLPSVVRKD